MRGLLLAGGHGTRLRPLTFSGNKHMIPIANRPMLFYGLQHLREAGIREVAIILGPIREGIEEAIGDGSSFGLEVTYIEQGPPKGLAHAVLCAREFLAEEPFVMYLGDNLLQDGVGPLTAELRERPGDAVIGVARVPDARPYGVVELRDGRIVSIVEKPVEPKSSLALIGVYLFTPKIHPIIARLAPSARGELEITEAIWRLHEQGGAVRVRQVAGWWKDTGRPEDLLEANSLILSSAPEPFFPRKGQVDPSADLTGSVGLGEGSVVGPGSRIRGPVVIGAGARIFGGATLGPGTSIGDGVEVRGASVEGSMLFDQARVSGPIHLRGSIIGRRAVVQADGGPVRELTCVLGDATTVRLA